MPLQNQRQEHINTASRASGPNRTPPSAIPNSYNQHAPRVCVCRAQAGGSPVPLESDEVLLSTFVDTLVPNYPFVALPPDYTPDEVASKYPFLWTTIQMVASYRHLSSMRSQNYFIMRHISEHLLMGSERSLEMLQSILLVLGSYHYHCMIHAQMNNLIALANSLAADLGINKAPDMQERTRLLQTNPEADEARTNDERRALCGVWYMTSIVSLAFQRIDPPRYTAYIDQCLRELEADEEYESDLLLVHLVRIQHLSERIAQLHVKDNVGDELAGMARAPVSAYSSMFHTELEKFRASLPQHLVSHRLITCHINTAVLRLWEPPRIDVALLERISNSLASLSLDSASSLDIFYRSSAALKAWFESWLSIEVTDYFVLPMPVCAQLINAVIMLARWSKLSSPERNFTPASASLQGQTQPQPQTQIVRNDPACGGAAMMPVPSLNSAREMDPAIPAAVRTIRSHLLSQPELQIDVPGILQAMASRFEHARETSEKHDRHGEEWENDIWDMAAKKINGTRLKLERWAQLVAAAGGEGRRPDQQQQQHPAGAGDPSDLSNGGAGQGQSSMEGGWAPMPAGIDIFAQQPAMERWSPGVSWANDFFEGLGMDQNFFFDGPGDFGGTVMNGLEATGG